MLCTGQAFKTLNSWLGVSIDFHIVLRFNAYSFRGSVVIDILPSSFVEYEWHNHLTSAGIQYDAAQLCYSWEEGRDEVKVVFGHPIELSATPSFVQLPGFPMVTYLFHNPAALACSYFFLLNTDMKRYSQNCWPFPAECQLRTPYDANTR